MSAKYNPDCKAGLDFISRTYYSALWYLPLLVDIQQRLSVQPDTNPHGST